MTPGPCHWDKSFSQSINMNLQTVCSLTSGFHHLSKIFKFFPKSACSQCLPNHLPLVIVCQIPVAKLETRPGPPPPPPSSAHPVSGAHSQPSVGSLHACGFPANCALRAAKATGAQPLPSARLPSPSSGVLQGHSGTAVHMWGCFHGFSSLGPSPRIPTSSATLNLGFCVLYSLLGVYALEPKWENWEAGSPGVSMALY